MCTWIIERTAVSGSGKGPGGWFPLTHANVYYDHPYHAPCEHTLNIDFVNEADGPAARVAVELTAGSARALVQRILAALESGDADHAEGEWLEARALPGRPTRSSRVRSRRVQTRSAAPQAPTTSPTGPAREGAHGGAGSPVKAKRSEPSQNGSP